MSTRANAAQATAITGVTGWRRPRAGEPVRRAFATEASARAAYQALLGVSSRTELVAPVKGTAAPDVSLRVQPDVWRTAKGALDAQQGPRTVTVTLAPGMSRSAAVVAFLRALAGDGASAGEDAALRLAEAMWNVGQGYTVEDLRLVDRSDGRVGWHPDNAADVEDRALHLGHAEAVLAHLVAAGWTPPSDRTAP